MVRYGRIVVDVHIGGVARIVGHPDLCNEPVHELASYLGDGRPVCGSADTECVGLVVRVVVYAADADHTPWPVVGVDRADRYAVPPDSAQRRRIGCVKLEVPDKTTLRRDGLGACPFPGAGIDGQGPVVGVLRTTRVVSEESELILVHTYVSHVLGHGLSRQYRVVGVRVDGFQGVVHQRCLGHAGDPRGRCSVQVDVPGHRAT